MIFASTVAYDGCIPRKTARVVLPSAQPEAEDDQEVSEDELEEGHIENADEDTDYLSEYPDETDVCYYFPIANWSTESTSILGIEPIASTNWKSQKSTIRKICKTPQEIMFKTELHFVSRSRSVFPAH